jgi:hypothetical protein
MCPGSCTNIAPRPTGLASTITCVWSDGLKYVIALVVNLSFKVLNAFISVVSHFHWTSYRWCKSGWSRSNISAGRQNYLVCKPCIVWRREEILINWKRGTSHSMGMWTFSSMSKMFFILFCVWMTRHAVSWVVRSWSIRDGEIIWLQSESPSFDTSWGSWFAIVENNLKRFVVSD